MRLDGHTEWARIAVHNQGQPIDAALLPRVFDYGVSGAEAGSKHRGQVEARNTDSGVEIVLRLKWAPSV